MHLKTGSFSHADYGGRGEGGREEGYPPNYPLRLWRACSEVNAKPPVLVIIMILIIIHNVR